ncbi:isoprenylcysteine carboxylmethyltransferase family protein [Rhizobium sp.]|uniref:isoprenylcysteine carboxylmethyltransferase family protein n=1 Tax=Rhizobium sp. TaxID=391 RepID=UPI0034C5B487
MSNYLIAFVVLAFAWRLLSVAISARHEKALKAAGGVEHGAGNSLLLAASHVLYYVSAIVESFNGAHVQNLTISIIGIIIYLAAGLVLVSVMRSLGELWTIKIIVGRQHRLVKRGLFSLVRHPNYFLNIIPELVGFALALNAYWTLVIGIPLYLIPLVTRIRQEEKVMRAAFPAYG